MCLRRSAGGYEEKGVYAIDYEGGEGWRGLFGLFCFGNDKTI